MINWPMREEKELDIGEEKAFQGAETACAKQERPKKGTAGSTGPNSLQGSMNGVVVVARSAGERWARG